MRRSALGLFIGVLVLAGCGASRGRIVSPPTGHRHDPAAEIAAARASNHALFDIFPASPATTPCTIPSGGALASIKARCTTSVTYPVTHGQYAEAFVDFRETWRHGHFSSWTVIVQLPADKVVATQLHGATAPQNMYAAYSHADVAMKTTSPSLQADIRIARNVSCFRGVKQADADEVKRFKAVTAVECGFPTRSYPGHGRWELEIRKIGVSGVPGNQRFWEQPDQPHFPPGGACTLNLVGLLAPIFVDANGRAIYPRTPIDGCHHPLGWPSGVKPVQIGWRVVSTSRIRHVITLPSAGAHCPASWGTEFPIASTGDSHGGPLFPGVPITVRACIYRTSATHRFTGSLVRELALNERQTRRLWKHGLTGAGPTTRCPVQRTFAWLISPAGDAVEVELGGCFRVARYLEWPGVGRADPKVVRALLG